MLSEPEAASVVMSVKDEGIGLVGEERTRLWERFFRGERHASNVPGSGLGLWIAKAFVTANGGEIEAVSEGADRGARSCQYVCRQQSPRWRTDGGRQ